MDDAGARVLLSFVMTGEAAESQLDRPIRPDRNFKIQLNGVQGSFLSFITDHFRSIPGY